MKAELSPSSVLLFRSSTISRTKTVFLPDDLGSVLVIDARILIKLRFRGSTPSFWMRRRVAAFGLDGGTFEMTGISAIPFSTSTSCAVVDLFSV
jgi:hypothetical protein